jgi:NAD(P)-dependent dehydrogenase (short-subunit alcohol dehydrogenase family)
MTDLSGTAVFVAGATGAVGRAVVARLAAAGARLALNGRRVAELEALGAKAAVYLPGDIGAPGVAERLLEEARRARGRVDALVYTVGGIDPAWPKLQDTTDEAAQRMLELNLLGALRAARAAAKVMAPGGRMAFVSSRGGVSPEPGGGAYAISKAALSAMIPVLAGDLRPAGIRVNAVAPSIILTPENRAAMPGADSGRWVTPDEIAAALAFLISGASSGVTGAIVPVYGRL